MHFDYHSTTEFFEDKIIQFALNSSDEHCLRSEYCIAVPAMFLDTMYADSDMICFCVVPLLWLIIVCPGVLRYSIFKSLAFIVSSAMLVCIC